MCVWREVIQDKTPCFNEKNVQHYILIAHELDHIYFIYLPENILIHYVNIVNKIFKSIGLIFFCIAKVL